MKHIFTHSILFFLVLNTLSLTAQIHVAADAVEGYQDGSSWVNAYTHLQTAINNAPDGSEIWIKEGTYKAGDEDADPNLTWFEIDKSIKLYGGFKGTETSLEERDWENNLTLLDADLKGDDVAEDITTNREDNAVHVVMIKSNGVVLDGLHIKNGQGAKDCINLPETHSYQGGGINIDKYSINIHNCFISRNYASEGGGLFVKRGEDKLTVEIINTVFDANEACVGGAMNLRPEVFGEFVGTTLTIENCLFKNSFGQNIAGACRIVESNFLIKNTDFENNNSTYDFGGGAVSLLHSSGDFETCNFIKNHTTAYGGALRLTYYNEVEKLNPQININNCSFKENNALGAGALSFSSDIADAQLWINNTSFETNKVLQSGGAIYAWGGEHTYTNCDFKDNIAEQDFAGAITVGNANSTFTQCVFENNQAQNSVGGGLFLWNNNWSEFELANADIIACEFIDNKAMNGGGLNVNQFYGVMSVNMDSCLFQNNEASSYGGGARFANYEDENNVNVYLTLKQNHTRYIDNHGEANDGGALVIENYHSKEHTNYELNHCLFEGNTGGILSGSDFEEYLTGPVGSIKNCDFINNKANFWGGAFDGTYDKAIFENCHFEGNFTEGAYPNAPYGGGAIALNESKGTSVLNSTFINNGSNDYGGTFYFKKSPFRMENSIVKDNEGPFVLNTNDTLDFLNTSLVNEELGIFLEDEAYCILQNTILSNKQGNLLGTGTIVSHGGNICTDETGMDYLTGYETYKDFNNTDPMLDENLMPKPGSPCIDAGNPEGIVATSDVLGNERIQGSGIDIGAIEASIDVDIANLYQNNSDISIVPNIVQSDARLLFTNEFSGGMELQIINISGQKVIAPQTINKAPPSFEYRLKLSHLAPGKYFVLLKNKKSAWLKSFIKK